MNKAPSQTPDSRPELSPRPAVNAPEAAPKPRRAKPSVSAEVRRLLSLADKLTNTAHALRKEAAAKLRKA